MMYAQLNNTAITIEAELTPDAAAVIITALSAQGFSLNVKMKGKKWVIDAHEPYPAANGTITVSPQYPSGTWISAAYAGGASQCEN